MKRTNYLALITGILLSAVLFFFRPTPASAQLYPTACSGVCRNVCLSSEDPNGETCANLTQDCCVPHVAPSCLSVGGQCRGTCLTNQMPTEGTCSPSTYNCCVPKVVTPTCTGGTCMTPGCSAGYVSHGDCNTTGYVCCEATGGCSSPNTCRAGGCLATEFNMYSCSTGTGTGSCCAPSVGATIKIQCYQNANSCGTLGCSANQQWVQSQVCNADWIASKGRYENCAEATGCVNNGGVCVYTSPANCNGGCHPSSCSPTCGLGGCPGGCGSIDNCGGVDCGTAGCTVPPGNTTGTPSCGNGTCGASETCSSCAQDCGVCPTSTPTTTVTPPVGCGDGICTAPAETCSICEQDCGACPAGIARVRARVVSNNVTTCDEVNASTTSVGLNVDIIPTVAPTGGQYVTGGNYATWTVPANINYTISPTTPDGFALKMACWDLGTGLQALIGDGQTVTWNLGYSIGTPWLQTSGGDVYAATNMGSPIAYGAVPRYFSLNGAGTSPGVVTYGTTYDFNSDTGATGEDYISSKGWLADDSYPTVDYYAVMYHRFGSPTTENYTPGSTITTEPASKATPYYINGDATIDVDITVASGEKIIFIVNGNLTIKKKITIASGGFAAFVTKGDIIIDSAVGTTAISSTPVIEGIYITSPTGTIYTGASTAASTRRFVGKGTFVAGSFNLQRDLDADIANDDTASELFIYNPELMIYMPEEMKDQPISWEEVAP